jgi:outer membrane protein
VVANAGYTRTNHVQEFAVPQPNGSRLVVYPDIPDNFASRVGFQWPIFTSGRTDALERAAAAEVSAVAADLETARADLRLEIVRAYWAAVTAREAVRVLEESAARIQAQVDDARRRFEVGLIAPHEVLGLESQRARERAQFIEARNLLDSALVDLRRLTGVERGTVLELIDPLDRSPVPPETADAAALINTALEARPERRALTLRLGSLEARQQAALTGNKPTINLTGGVDYANPNPRIFPRSGEWQESWDVGVSVHWNVFDFGRARAQAAEAGAAVTAARRRMAEFDSLVAADIQHRLLELESTRAMVAAASEAVKSAAEARRVVGERFMAGVATSTDVLVAQTTLLETELGRTRALAAERLAEARMARTVGRR